MRTAFQFSTFVMRDAELPVHDIPGLPDTLRKWSERVLPYVPVSASTFAYPDRAVIAGDISATHDAHIACFIEDLAVAEWYAAHRTPADCVAGYSMGLYPALVYVEALSIGDALRVMRGACAAAHSVAGSGPFAMLAITGASAGAVEALCTSVAPAVELTDRYAPDTQLLTGTLVDVLELERAATAQGWNDTLVLPVSAPFHSRALRAAEQPLAELLADIRISAPRCPVRSSTVPQWLTTPTGVREELCRNVWSPMDWGATILALADAGARTFVECGVSRRLSRVATRVLGSTYTIRGLVDEPASTPR